MPGQELAPLVCPKCQGSMRQYERSGLIIDQCDSCRGIFLDRGELERLIEAEDAHYRPGAGAPAAQQPPQQQGYPQQGYPQGYPPQGPMGGGFLGGLFGGGHHGGYGRGHH